MGVALRSNTHLERLDADRNGFGDLGVLALADALHVNAALKIVTLIDNSVGDGGAGGVAAALRRNARLVEVRARAQAGQRARSLRGYGSWTYRARRGAGGVGELSITPLRACPQGRSGAEGKLSGVFASGALQRCESVARKRTLKPIIPSTCSSRPLFSFLCVRGRGERKRMERGLRLDLGASAALLFSPARSSHAPPSFSLARSGEPQQDPDRLLRLGFKSDPRIRYPNLILTR